MSEYILGRKVKAYRVIHCAHCNQFFEIDLAEVFPPDFEGGTLSVKPVCPWCEHEHNIKFVNLHCGSDRLVRYD